MRGGADGGMHVCGAGTGHRLHERPKQPVLQLEPARVGGARRRARLIRLRRALRLRRSGHDYAGRYAAARTWSDSCGQSAEDLVELSITQSPPLINIEWRDPAGADVCRLTGELIQEGNRGRTSGVIQCDRTSGNGEFLDMLQVAEKFSARFATESASGCHIEGEITAIRRR